MKSSVVERSRVSVEDAFWKGLQEIIVERHDEPLSDRQFANLSSAGWDLMAGLRRTTFHRGTHVRATT